MEIKLPKLIQPVDQSTVTTEDLLRKPKVPSSQKGFTTSGKVSFFKEELHYHGKPIALAIEEILLKNPLHLTKIAEELEKYRDDVLKRKKELSEKKQLSEAQSEKINTILALCHAYLLEISEKLKNQYDQNQTGIYVFFDYEGQLLLNGINVNLLIEQCRGHKLNEQSQVFLRGIQKKLFAILENRTHRPVYEKIQGAVFKLVNEIDSILQSDLSAVPEQFC